MIEILTLCGLCGKNKNLKESHIISKFIYKNIRNNQPYKDERHKLPMVADGKTNTLQKSGRQYKQYLFCGECEALFSAKETVMSKVIADIQAMDATKKNLHLGYSTNSAFDDDVNFPYDVENKLYFNLSLAKDIKYFFLSMIYRGVVSEDLKVNEAFLSDLREYLLGKRKVFHVKAIAIANGSAINFPVATSVAIQEFDKETHFCILVPEFLFRLILDKHNPVPDEDNFFIIPEDLANCKEVDSILRPAIPEKRITENAKKYLKHDGFQEQ